jgi:cytoskeletal protein CcmA (bactofilin family)
MWNATTSADRGSRPGAPETTYESMAEEVEATRIPVLGKTLFFRGELTAEEDLILQGRVEGSIRHARALIIGCDGSVLGDVHANHLTVEGMVEGDLHASEAVVVKATAQVRGNIFAPRVGIMEGAVFNGRIEMDPGARAAVAPPTPAPQGAKTPAAAPRQTGAASAAAPNRPAASAPAPRQGVILPPSRGAQAPPTPPPAAASSSPLPNAAVDQLLAGQAPKK